MKEAKALRSHLALLPPQAQVLSPDLALVREDGEVVFFNGSGPIYSCAEQDEFALRVAGGMMVHLGLASLTAVAEGLGVHPSTICRNRDRFRLEGVEGLRPQRTGPRGAHKLRGRLVIKAQRLLDKGVSIRRTASQVGVVEGTIRYALRTGVLSRTPSNEPAKPEERSAASGNESSLGESGGSELSRPGVRSSEDASCEGGVAVKRTGERAMARVGLLGEAEPQFEPAEAVANAGVLLALPAMLEEGLLGVGKEVYGALRNGFFGLRATLLSLGFMALLRIKTPQQLANHAPGELGHLLGLDRAPEVKTLRRKLSELAERSKAHVFRAALSLHWVEKRPEVVGFLYVDGHVRPYNGKKQTLPKAFVPRRRLSMPATTDFWVNDEEANPVFFITAPANDGLVSMLDGEVLPEIRRLVGQGRKVTVIFDREGWSPKRFEQWKGKSFDVITYRKAPYEDWPEEDFTDQELPVGGKSVRLAERSVEVGRGFSMREIRKLCDDGHQLSIMTTREDLPAPEIAERMFSRWRQENFFRYMRHEYALDHLCTNTVESADGDRLVPNPQRREKRKKLKELRAQLSKLERDYGEQALANPENQRSTMRGFKIAHADLGKRIRQLKQRCEATNSAMKALPERVPIRELLDEKQIVQLEQERKVLTDTVKMVAYRAETSLTELLRPFFPRHEEEARNFMKAVFRLPADLIPMVTERRMIVRLHSMSNPRSNRALTTLCDVVNQCQTRYPDTDLRLVFETV